MRHIATGKIVEITVGLTSAEVELIVWALHSYGKDPQNAAEVKARAAVLRDQLNDAHNAAVCG